MASKKTDIPSRRGSGAALERSRIPVLLVLVILVAVVNVAAVILTLVGE